MGRETSLYSIFPRLYAISNCKASTLSELGDGHIVNGYGL